MRLQFLLACLMMSLAVPGIALAGGTDADGDGFFSDVGDELDCDDTDPLTYPGAEELCDELDNDCNGLADGGDPGNAEAEVDDDRDGASECEGDCDDTNAFVNILDQDGDGFSSCDGDCAIANPDFYPGAPELCDAIDNDCDGELPEEELDQDEDGRLPCEGDCDDFDPERSDLVAEAIDVNCDDAVDNDCDTLTDLDDDDCIPLNLPPTVFTGQAPQERYVAGPVTLVFDASPSEDPERVPLTYTWEYLGPEGDYADVSVGELVADTSSGYAMLPVTVTGGTETSWSFRVALTITDEDDTVFENWTTVGPIEMVGTVFRPTSYLPPGCAQARRRTPRHELLLLAAALFPLLLRRRSR